MKKFFVSSLLLIEALAHAASYIEVRSGLCNPAEAGMYRYRNTSVLACEYGRVFWQEFRFGIQLGYNQFDCSNAGKLLAGGHPMNLGNVKCRTYAYSLFLNLYYDCDLPGRWKGFIGLGLGGMRIRLFSHTLDGGDDYFNSEAKFVFACQLITGVAYRINDTWSLVADYRCQKIENFGMKTKDALDVERFPTVHTPLLHCFEIGLRYTF